MNIAYITNTDNQELFLKWNNHVSRTVGIGTFCAYPLLGFGYGAAFIRNVFPEYFSRTEFDVLVYLDVDCFPLVPADRLTAIAKWLRQSPYTYAGVPDGGMVCHRCGDPMVPNLFLTLFDLRKIRKFWRQGQVIEHLGRLDYPEGATARRNTLTAKLPVTDYPRLEVVRKDGMVPFSAFGGSTEPYYNFFYWLTSHGAEPFYLRGDDAPEIDGDGAATLVYDHEGRPLAVHSWFARAYGKDFYHTNRIDRIIRYAHDQFNRR